jgi:uncharacterized membrane protein
MVSNIKNYSLKLADVIAAFIGSWKFIIIQSVLLTIWIIINTIGIVHFDSYPFILLNLFLSFEAAYATPLILMSSNRQSEQDREQLTTVLKIDEEDHLILAELKRIISDLHEDIKLDKQGLKDHKKLKTDHEELKEAIAELLVEIKKRDIESV